MARKGKKPLPNLAASAGGAKAAPPLSSAFGGMIIYGF